MRRFKNKPVKILIVEDDPDVLNALNIALGSVGFDVDVMLNGKDIFTNQFVLPDLFIIDQRLPDSDGLDICRYLKTKPNYKDIPVILISASPIAKEKAFEAGASDFIAKPFVVKELIDSINHTLDLMGAEN
jgi:DNA-binding response OmpR family regulator